jgi:hypothetical protein
MPPAATGLVFLDVPTSLFAAPFIEKLKEMGITGGCGPGYFCPNNYVSRETMAVMIQKTFGMPMPTP